jgi:hypothetical protein
MPTVRVPTRLRLDHFIQQLQSGFTPATRPRHCALVQHHTAARWRGRGGSHLTRLSPNRPGASVPTPSPRMPHPPGSAPERQKHMWRVRRAPSLEASTPPRSPVCDPTVGMCLLSSVQVPPVELVVERELVRPRGKRLDRAHQLRQGLRARVDECPPLVEFAHCSLVDG